MKIPSSFIEHTNLKQDTTKKDIIKLCEEAIDYEFHAVCVNPHFVSFASEYLSESIVKVVSVVGFPLGANKTEIKMQESLLAIKDGADELDMVANIGLIKSNRYKEVETEIAEIRKNIPYNVLLKVIVESSQLSDIEIVEATKLVINSGADFVKTSTGFFGGASVDAVNLMRETANGQIQIKASGGIKTLSNCRDMVSAGASRLGCSASVDIMREIDEKCD